MGKSGGEGARAAGGGGGGAPPAPGARCGRCGALLAGADQATQVDGRSGGVFINPAGQRFTLIFFDEAPGCATAGPASDEATWFPGHTWQRCFCRGCAHHAGWLFRSKTRTFWALRIDG